MAGLVAVRADLQLQASPRLLEAGVAQERMVQRAAVPEHLMGLLCMDNSWGRLIHACSLILYVGRLRPGHTSHVRGESLSWI